MIFCREIHLQDILMWIRSRLFDQDTDTNGLNNDYCLKNVEQAVIKVHVDSSPSLRMSLRRVFRQIC